MAFSFDSFEWHTLTQRLSLALIHFAWQATLAMGLLVLALELTPRDRPRIRYAISTAVLFLLPFLALFTFSSVVPQDRRLADREEVSNLGSTDDRSALTTVESESRPLQASMERRANSIETRAYETLAASQLAESDAKDSRLPVSSSLLSRTAPWVSALYSLGVFWMLLRTAIGITEGRRLCRQASPITSGPLTELMRELSRDIGLARVPSLAQSNELLVPAVIGVLRPTILLPCSLATGLGPNEISAILSHELAHVRRHDVFIGVCQRALESIFFFHPAVWWISRQVSREREDCCDDAAIRSGHATTGYIEALLRSAELCLSKDDSGLQAGAIGVGFFGEDRSELTRRVERLLAVQESKRWALPRVFATGLIVVFFGAFACLGAMGQGSDADNTSSDAQVSSDDILVGRVAVKNESEETDAISDFDSYRTHLLNSRTKERASLLKRFGGTAETEEAVAMGLQWILRQQREDGSWSFEPVAATVPNQGRADEMALAGTAMALLALTGDGNTHQSGAHRQAVKRGAAFVMVQQNKDGRFGRQQMYVHAIAAYAIADLYALTGDPALKPSLERAVSYSIQAQNPIGGGWRYMPRQGGDLSMTTWFVAGLSRARDAGISIPEATFLKAKQFVESTGTGKGFGYLPGSPATLSMSGAGVLCLQRLAGIWRSEAYSSVAESISEAGFESSDQDFYQWLQVTQALRQNGGNAWDKWNETLRRELPQMQRRKGGDAGSWPHEQAKFGKPVGPLYSTCFAVLTLQSYYRDGVLPFGKPPVDDGPLHYRPPSGTIVRIHFHDDSATIEASQSVKVGLLQSFITSLKREDIHAIAIAALKKDAFDEGEEVDDTDEQIDLRFDEKGAEVRMSKAVPYKYVSAILKALTEHGFQSMKIGLLESDISK